MFQGQLKSAGSAVTGNCDMTFSLYDDAWQARRSAALFRDSPGDQRQFSVMLNSGGEFGANAFNGYARWLQVAVKCPGDAGLHHALPRQQIAAAPYAQYALTGNNAAPPHGFNSRLEIHRPMLAYTCLWLRYCKRSSHCLRWCTGSLPHPSDVWVLTNASGLGGHIGLGSAFPRRRTTTKHVNGTAVYDSNSNRLIVHGGCAGNCSPALSDTWVLSNANGWETPSLDTTAQCTSR